MSNKPSATPEALIARIVMAQNLAAHQNSVVAITSNEVGGFNILPLSVPQGDEVILAVGQIQGNRLDPAQLNQLLRIGEVWPEFTKHDTVQAAFALGYNTAEHKLKSAVAQLQKLADELLDGASTLEGAADTEVTEETTPTRLQKDGMPSFYITHSGLTCTHRTSEDDVPVWVKGAADAMAAMSRIDKNVERKSKRREQPKEESAPDDRRKFVDLRQLYPAKKSADGGAQ